MNPEIKITRPGSQALLLRNSKLLHCKQTTNRYVLQPLAPGPKRARKWGPGPHSGGKTEKPCMGSNHREVAWRGGRDFLSTGAIWGWGGRGRVNFKAEVTFAGGEMREKASP